MLVMVQAEKDKLLALLDSEERWCQDAEARDEDGNPVRHSDVAAVAWDISGALCRLFGWRRARELFVQLDRHVNGRREPVYRPARDAGIDSMVALQAFNDRDDTTFEVLREQIRTIRVWHGNTDANAPR